MVQFKWRKIGKLGYGSVGKGGDVMRLPVQVGSVYRPYESCGPYSLERVQVNDFGMSAGLVAEARGLVQTLGQGSVPGCAGGS
jgi:hypothetical protein